MENEELNLIFHSLFFYMALPFFYAEDIKTTSIQFVLNEDTSKHVVQVLRMQIGEEMQLTDGKGNLYTAEIIDDNRKRCVVKTHSFTSHPAPVKKISIAVSLIKNSTRFEWLLEKTTEIGVSEIIPLICSRTEKQHFRHDRMKSILVSAMLQSQQCWLPRMSDPIKFTSFVQQPFEGQQFIAHCEDDKPRYELTTYLPFERATILIGPEGDFSVEEIGLALNNNFKPVVIGETRLRTETAAVVAATLLKMC
jgi:16S rRNA (uracil1498-N3)-methyltransferase